MGKAMGGDTLREWFEHGCSRHREKIAIRFYRGRNLETVVSYGRLGGDSGEMAKWFLGLGVSKGERIVLCMEKSLIFVVSHIGAQMIGAVTVPLNPGYKASELSYLINDAEPRLILAGRDQKERINERIFSKVLVVEIDTEAPYQTLDFYRYSPGGEPREDVSPADPAMIIYTSGTTGKPKGAVLTHGNLVHDARNIQKTWEITAGDVLCHALPLFHVHGLCFALHTCLLAGATILMLDRFSPGAVLDLLSRKRGEDDCSIFMGVPTMYGKMADYLGEENRDFSHIRLLTSGSAPLPVKDFERIRRIFGKEPVEREGMTETGMNFSNPIHGEKKPGSIGLPMPGLDVRIVDPVTYQDLEPGMIGEIWLKGPGITPGYWRKPRETADAFVDEWFRTGDLGKVDENGYYYITDRLKNVIISGGENISPKEVEDVINSLDGVVESSVVGIKDARWGEKVVAAIVPEPGKKIDAKGVQDHCKKYLHDWKCPKEITIVDQLPRNAMGKVLREEVKALFSGRQASRNGPWVLPFLRIPSRGETPRDFAVHLYACFHGIVVEVKLRVMVEGVIR
ncbi:MAG: AMP-binding protein [Deltaproteobacteria bacterium]|nr:AMP-binding protein [Deltaproteobacteria bacterium]